MKASPSLRLKIDSREQKPLEFKDGVFSEIISDGLPIGDYWCELKQEEEWRELPLVFERKGLGDLFLTMTSNYSRFKHEMSRAKEFGIELILLIEGSMEEVWRGYKHSQFSGESMLKKLATLRTKHDLEYHFCNNRREMARLI